MGPFHLAGQGDAQVEEQSPLRLLGEGEVWETPSAAQIVAGGIALPAVEDVGVPELLPLGDVEMPDPESGSDAPDRVEMSSSDEEGDGAESARSDEEEAGATRKRKRRDLPLLPGKRARGDKGGGSCHPR